MIKIKNLNIKLLLTIFMVFRICSDIFRGTIIFNFEILGISLLETLNIIFLFFLLFLTLKDKGYDKSKKMIFYTIIFLIYIIIHSIYVTNLINNSFSFKLFLSESYYIVRSYGMPLLYLYLLIKNEYTKNDCKKLFILLISVISLSIVILNLLNISINTYSANYKGDNIYTVSNIFSWPTFIKGNYDFITSKGWFWSGNGISAMLFMSLPITLYYHYKEQKNKKILLILITQLLAMLMLGTRVSTYGSLIILFGFSIYLIFEYIFTKKKYKSLFTYILILIIFSVVFIFSPGFKRNLFNNNQCFYPICVNRKVETPIEDNSKDKLYNAKEIKKMSDEKLIEVLNNRQTKQGIPGAYYDIVPIEENIDFWRKIFVEDSRDWRKIKKSILQYKLEEKNLQNKNYFGMGHISGYPYVETDFISEYYYFGIIGMIILFTPVIGIYLKIFIKFIRLFFKDSKKYFKLSFVMLAGLIGILVGAISGHVFYQITSFYFLVLVIYVCYISVEKYKINKE